VATIDHPVTAHPDPGDQLFGLPQLAGPRAGRWEGWFGPDQGLRPRPVDVLLAAAIAFVQVAGTVLYSEDEPNRWAFDALACVPLTVGPAALLFRRRWPEAAVLVTFAAAAGYAATGYPRGPAGLPAFMFALVSAIMMGRSALAWRVLLVAYPAFTLLPSLVPDEVEKARSLAGTAANLVWLPLVPAASEIARVRLERRAERARTAQEEARRRASQERLLIARELHDVLAHNISLINVQSGVALHLLDERPEQARPALQAINEASEEALGELRSVLDVLSRGLGDDGTTGGAGAWVPRSPTAGVRELDGLVRRTRAAGLDVDLDVEGEVRPVPAGVDLAAFRIVQEALTNVVRHAGGDARATVRLRYLPGELVVQVDDDGRPSEAATGSAGSGPSGGSAGSGGSGQSGGSGRTSGPGRSGGSDTVRSGAGRGIAGMRERVHALGGTFAAGPRPGRGFRVRARFPLEEGAG
jgi:signal transduction histidine kinase